MQLLYMSVSDIESYRRSINKFKMAESESKESPSASSSSDEMMDELKQLSKSELSELSRAVQLKIEDMSSEVTECNQTWITDLTKPELIQLQSFIKTLEEEELKNQLESEEALPSLDNNVPALVTSESSFQSLGTDGQHLETSSQNLETDVTSLDSNVLVIQPDATATDSDSEQDCRPEADQSPIASTQSNSQVDRVADSVTNAVTDIQSDALADPIANAIASTDATDAVEILDVDDDDEDDEDSLVITGVESGVATTTQPTVGDAAVQQPRRYM